MQIDIYKTHFDRMADTLQKFKLYWKDIFEQV